MGQHYRTHSRAHNPDNAHLRYEGGAVVEAVFQLADRWKEWRRAAARRQPTTTIQSQSYQGVLVSVPSGRPARG